MKAKIAFLYLTIFLINIAQADELKYANKIGKPSKEKFTTNEKNKFDVNELVIVKDDQNNNIYGEIIASNRKNPPSLYFVKFKNTATGAKWIRCAEIGKIPNKKWLKLF